MENEIIKNADITILVNSCDFYEDAWDPFFKLLKIQWPNCPYNIALNTENREYECKFMNVRTIKTGKEVSWTARLRSALYQIDSEYILFFLEDFFLLSEVREESFSKAIEIISSDNKIGLVHFTPSEISMNIPKYDLENCFYELPVRKRTLRTRVAVSLFRKEYFLRLLYKDENPWQYERESHFRSMFAGYKIIRQDYNKYPQTFDYFIDIKRGLGITQKKWLPGNQPFFESMGINDVNYDRLGVLEEKNPVENKSKIETKNEINDIGFRQWFYNKVTHPIKRKIRHVWILQDILNFKKYIKYWNYYRKIK